MSEQREPIILDLTEGTVVTVHRDDDGQVHVDVQDADAGLGAGGGAPRAGGAGAAAPRVIQGRMALGLKARQIRPGLWTATDVTLVAGCAASSGLIVGLLLHVLGSSPGWLLDLVVWYALFIVLTYFATRDQLGPQAAGDRVATVIITTGALLLLAPLASLLIYVMSRGLPNLRLNFFLNDLSGVLPSAPPTEGGGRHAIIGTLQQAGLALVLVLPLGVTTAVFLNETRSRLRRPVRIFVDAMSGLPSIVAGLFIYSALIINGPVDSPLFGFNGLMAALAISLVMLPTVTRTVEVVLRLVPDGLREASLALGASRVRTVWSVVLPTARSGVSTAVVLGLARVIGETAPLLFTSFGSSLINSNPFDSPQESLPLYVYRLVKLPSENESTRGYVGATVLILLVLLLFFLARAIGSGKLFRFLPGLPRRRGGRNA